MKKVFAVLLSLLFFLSGCSQKEAEESPPVYTNPSTDTVADIAADESELTKEVNNAAESDIIEISEKLFIAQTNDVYYNSEDYLGKTIRYEGLYQNSEEWSGPDNIMNLVIRYGPGCCGDDGMAGFEVYYDDEYPDIDDWVEVVGIVCEEEYESGYTKLFIQAQSITVLDIRGAEYVTT